MARDVPSDLARKFLWRVWRLHHTRYFIEPTKRLKKIFSAFRPISHSGRRTFRSELDYADQRYYASSWGRFLSPDPYMATAISPNDSRDPQSWNRYSYAGGDPANQNDPTGEFFAFTGSGWCEGRFQT